MLPMTPQSWNTAVRALPALIELIQQPSCSAAMLERVAHASLEHIQEFRHTDKDQVLEAAGDVIGSITQLLKYDSVIVRCTAAYTLCEISLHPGNQVRMVAAGAVGQLVHLLKSTSAIVQVVQAAVVRPLANIASFSIDGAR